MIVFDTDSVIATHDEILRQTQIGLKGVDRKKLEGALARINHHICYEEANDVYVIAAWYGVSISKAHAFNDGNKRTALVVMLAYLSAESVDIQSNIGLDDTMVQVVASKDDHKVIVSALAAYLRSVTVF